MFTKKHPMVKLFSFFSIISLLLIFYAANNDPLQWNNADKISPVLSEQDSLKQNIELYMEVLGWVKNSYEKEIDFETLIRHSINGMLRNIDPHSALLTPELRKELEESTTGEFGGVGMHVTMRDGVLTVIAPIEGTPAFKEGILPWDRIVTIDGESTEGMTLFEAVNNLKGTPGTEVTIEVVRRGHDTPITVTIERDIIKIQRLYSRMLTSDIGYIRLVEFSENVSSDMEKIIKELEKEGMKALIVDVRNNSGGLLTESIKVSDLFLERNKDIVSIRSRLDKDGEMYSSTKQPIFKGPMTILINSGTASASEIFAGAMQDHRRASIVGITGQKSFGKGSVQSIIPLETPVITEMYPEGGKAALKLTVAKYYTPKGVSIEDIGGLDPDFSVAVSLEKEIDLRMQGRLGEPSLVEEIPSHEERDDVQDTNDFGRRVIEDLGPRRDREDPEELFDKQLDKALEISQIKLFYFHQD